MTPSEKRKNLLLQHQQRSSVDTEAIETEDHAYDQVSTKQTFYFTFSQLLFLY